MPTQSNTITVGAFAPSDVADAIAVALEHSPVSRSDFCRLREARKAKELSGPELEKACASTRRAALEGVQAKYPDADEDAIQAAVDAELQAQPRGFDVVDPCSPGDLQRPSFLLDGLIYAGRSHELFGRPGTNKTLWIVWVLAQLAAEGQHVLLIEYEMDGPAVGTYLNELGFDRAALRPFFHQVIPSLPWGAERLDELVGAFPGCAAVALDNVAEAIQSAGGDENVAGDTLKALAPLRDLAHSENGPAVLTADHLPHARENASRGTTAKGALIDVAFQVETPHPVTRDRAGDIKLTCQKDRPSLIGKGNEIWFAVGDGKGGLPLRQIETPGKLTDELSSDGATMIVRLQDYAEKNPGNPWLSKAKVYDVAGLKKSRKRDAELQRLANDPGQPLVAETRPRGNAPATTLYRWDAADDSASLYV